MNILICNFEYPPIGGGGGVVTSLLAQELALDHDVTVLTSDGFGLPKDGVEDGIRIVRVPVWSRKRKSVASMSSMLAFVITGVPRGMALLREQEFDVINTHFVLPTGPVGDYLSRSAGIPNVLSLHGGDLYEPTKRTSPHRHYPLRLWIRRLLARADMVVGQSRDTLNNMHRFYTQKVPGIRIPLGIRIPAVNGASKSEFGFSDRDRLLVTVGRIVKRKAIHQLIDMMKELKDPLAHLLIIGSGPLRDQLEQRAVEAGISDQVHLAGYVEEETKLRMLQAADLFVSTSQHEGFGLVFLEAMASKLPIVCYDHGGQTDFLSDGSTGYLIPLNDMERLTERVKQLIGSAKLRESMGEFNRELVGEYSIQETASKYEAALIRAIERYSVQREAVGQGLSKAGELQT